MKDDDELVKLAQRAQDLRDFWHALTLPVYNYWMAVEWVRARGVN